MNPQIWIRTKISWIRNTDFEPKNLFIFLLIGGGVSPSSSRVGWDRTAWFLDAKENSEGLCFICHYLDQDSWIGIQAFLLNLSRDPDFKPGFFSVSIFKIFFLDLNKGLPKLETSREARQPSIKTRLIFFLLFLVPFWLSWIRILPP